MSIADKLTTIAENIPEVYEAGKTAEYDEFWDNYQFNGKLTYYAHAFAGRGWNNISFKPKYKIQPTYAYGMFWDSINITDISNADLDFSNCTNAQMAFMDTGIQNLGILDFSKCTNISDVCSSSKLKRIESFIMPSVTTQYANSPFRTASNLEYVIISGTIKNNGFRIPSTKLDKDSIISVINALSSTTTGLTVTLSSVAVNNIDWSKTDYGSFEALIAPKENWTIALV